MKEVKSPKKPLLYYYGIVLLIIALFNLLVTPLLNRRSIVEVDYGTFMSKIEAQQIEKVEIDDDEIYYTEKGGKTVYCTGIMDDPGLTERLYASGATFSRDVQKTMSPLLSFFLTSIVPLLLFLALGRYVGKKLVEQAGGKNAMAFGKSNAKVYVQSTAGIHFSDVAGGQGEPGGDRRLSARSEEVHRCRRLHAKGHPARRPSGNRQDHAGQGCRG